MLSFIFIGIQKRILQLLIASINDDYQKEISFEKKNTDCVIYEIKYLKNFNIASSLYLVFNNVDGYIEYNPTENDIETKCLDFASTDINKEAIENYTDLWYEVKDQIETISGYNPIEYGKDFMKARFESNDDLYLGINYYPQVSLYECLYRDED